MVEQNNSPMGIRWGELAKEIAAAAAEDERTFSQEARYLVKMGLERRKKLDFGCVQAAECRAGLAELAAREQA